MSFVKNHIYVLSCIVGTDGGSLLIRVCHLSKITFMFCHVLWGQTGVSLLIRVCHLSTVFVDNQENLSILCLLYFVRSGARCCLVGQNCGGSVNGETAESSD